MRGNGNGNLLKSRDRLYLWIVLALFVLSSLPVWNLFANSKEMFGPMPMTLTWSYLWFGAAMILTWVIYGTTFKDWAQRADRWAANLTDEEANR